MDGFFTNVVVPLIRSSLKHELEPVLQELCNLAQVRYTPDELIIIHDRVLLESLLYSRLMENPMASHDVIRAQYYHDTYPCRTLLYLLPLYIDDGIDHVESTIAQTTFTENEEEYPIQYHHMVKINYGLRGVGYMLKHCQLIPSFPDDRKLISVTLGLDHSGKETDPLYLLKVKAMARFLAFSIVTSPLHCSYDGQCKGNDGNPHLQTFAPRLQEAKYTPER